MEDEGGVKVPVTRLRRRLSVEQSDEMKSSPAPITPTKKRATRRAAKPELDLIEENAPENVSPKKSAKKAIAKDIEVEEKPVTPSRRSARIKSNTSLVLETTQTFDSPRAKRVTRRTSQIGSDNEAPLTPARQTRRTRKDSVSNSEKAESLSVNKQSEPITETIVEEPESILLQSQKDAVKTIEEKQSPSKLRKSPRLSLKKDKGSNSVETSEENKVHTNDKNDYIERDNSNKENETHDDITSIKNVSVDTRKSNIQKNDRLSASSQELLNELNTEPKIKSTNMNKSSSALPDNQPQFFKHKRYLSESWTTLPEPVLNDNKCYSDTESAKKKNLLNKSNNSDLQNKNIDLDVSYRNKRKNILEVSLKAAEAKIVDSPYQYDNQKLLSPPKNDPSPTMCLFSKGPTNDMQTMVYIEDSDSNSERPKVSTRVEDQCVPIVQTENNILQTKQAHNSFNSSKGNAVDEDEHKNDSCEPMDIDETFPDNALSNKSILKTLETSHNQVEDCKNQSLKGNMDEKYKDRKICLTSQNLNKTDIENKSTLILSQLKDISNENDVSHSPQVVKKLSKSEPVLDITQDNEVDKKNQSLNYLTSTPLEQKSLIKRAMQVNTSGITSNNTSKIEKSCIIKSKNSSQDSESGEESSREQSNFVDAEAEEASDDYESGDSRDEEEEQYERDHEIVQKGETLTSEDESGNDIDYEKDSFVVSTDEEDEELLNGSDDDLSMSDNELKMTTKSKKKYDERQRKDQKKASREMFESRHKLNGSNKRKTPESAKIKKNRVITDSSDSEYEDIKVKKQKNNRMRLDSSRETSVNKSLENNSKLRNDKSFSKSEIIENEINEIEMKTIDDNGKDEIDPLSIEIKKEPRTPEKSALNTSLQFIDTNNWKKNEDDCDKSKTNKTQGDDPLQESNECDSSDSSENVHIQNYDSILNDLNKSVINKKVKEGDISLNLNKKSKQKNVSIVDQLNLTGIKSNKLKHKYETKVDSKKSSKSLNDKSKKIIDNNSDSDSSDSIALNLLFSEDGNSSEIIQCNKKKIEVTSKEEDIFTTKEQSKDKINVSETSGEDDEVHFYLDTTGTHGVDVDASLNPNTSNKIMTNSKCIEHEDNNSESDDMKISNKRTLPNIGQVNTEVNKSLSLQNKSITKTPKSDKKKKRTSESISTTQTGDGDKVNFFIDSAGTHNIEVDMSFDPNTSQKKKKKGKSVQDEDKNSDSDAPLEISSKPIISDNVEQVNAEANKSLTVQNKSMNKTPKSDKKKKRLSESTPTQPDFATNTSLLETDKSEKKKSQKLSQSTAIEEIDSAINTSLFQTSGKKIAKKPSKLSATNDADSATNTSLHEAGKSGKKKAHKLSDSNTTDEIDSIINTSLLQASNKKKAIKLPESTATGDIENVTESTGDISSSKKRKRKSSLTKTESDEGQENVIEDMEKLVGSKKRKRKSSPVQIDRDDEMKGKGAETNDTSVNINVCATAGVQKRKRKNPSNEDSGNLIKDTTLNIKIVKEQKRSTPNQVNHKSDNADINCNKTKGMKKRKEREDDEGSKMAKMQKLESYDKDLVPRLSTTILNQLEDKPKKNHDISKSKPISTTNFVVEKTKIRKPKPSNYLEESIYLNDAETLESKKQKHIKNPKVLPFLPTVCTSNSGYTTNFKVSILPKEIHFVAKSTNIDNYKNDYLQNKKNKKLGTYELYKRNRNLKMSKF